MPRGRTLTLATVGLCVATAVRADDPPAADPREHPTAAENVPPEQAPATGEDTTRLKELVVEARRPLSAATAEEHPFTDYDLRPHSTQIDILNDLPGMVVEIGRASCRERV